MKKSLNHMKYQKPFIVILILAHLMGCTHWKVLKEPYAEQIEKEKPEKIEVESIYGRKIKLDHPHIVGDTLFGIYERNDPITFESKRDTIHLTMIDVKQIKIESINPYCLILLGVVFTSLLITAIIQDKSEPGYWW